MERVREVLSVLDVMYQFSPGYMSQVVNEALQYREHVSQGARDSLNAAINNSGVRLDGFRDTSRADADSLTEAVFDQLLEGNERLLRSVLRTWMECREVLRAQVALELSRLGIMTEGMRGKGDDGIGIWDEEDWNEKLQTVLSEIGDADELDVRLMMTCVSGMAPDLPEEVALESEMFNRWLDQLREMALDAAEWFELDDFLEQAEGIAREKLVERLVYEADRLRQVLEESQAKFEDELNYLEIDLNSWLDDAKEHPAVFPKAVQVVESMHDSLLDYMKLKPTGKTRREEIERRVERERCEDILLGLSKEWEELVRAAEIVEEEVERKRIEEEAAGDVKVGLGESDDASPQPEEASVSPGESEVGVEKTPQAASAMAELEEAREQNERLRLENAAVETKSRGLRVKVTDLEEEVDRLRRELYESQQTEKVWRKQFVSVSKALGDGKEETQAEIGDVGDAVERARRAFPNQLVVALNSKSDVATPFQRPEEVYNVLAWLGTEYHRARTRELGRDPQFDKLLKEACSGWFYKPKQTYETKDQYPDWYRTRLGDREYELDAHVGKGTSFDPQNTIRIAFDWDEEGKRVVVGYIGRHQKNRRS